jgi:transcriptional regulator with XRE-family HTH domain
MNPRTQDQLDKMSPEKRAKAEAFIARQRTPEARAERAAALDAIETEIRETGGITTTDGVLHRPKVLPPVAVIEENAVQLLALGQVIRELRNASRKSLASVAQVIGVDASAIAKIERGENANPTVVTLAKIADALGGRFTIGIDVPPGGLLDLDVPTSVKRVLVSQGRPEVVDAPAGTLDPSMIGPIHRKSARRERRVYKKAKVIFFKDKATG